MYRHAVAPGAATADRRVKSADARQINQSDHRLADDRIGNRDAPQGKAAKEIVGPVDRIDNPAALARPSPALLPRKPSSGKASASRVRISASTSRSATLTKSCGPFVSRVRVTRRAKYPAARSPASWIRWVATARRAWIVMAVRRPP